MKHSAIFLSAGWVSIFADHWVWQTGIITLIGFFALFGGIYLFHLENKKMSTEQMQALEQGLNGTTAEDLKPAYTTASFTKMPVGDLFFEDNGKRFRYNPKPDITPQEVSYICHLFLSAAIGSHGRGFYDYLRFVADKQLTRHFDEVTE